MCSLRSWDPFQETSTDVFAGIQEKHKQERALLPSCDSSRPDVAWKGCPCINHTPTTAQTLGARELCIQGRIVTKIYYYVKT